jgi:hypothetical protein
MGIREIQLTQGKVALVDADDYGALKGFNWYFCKGYALRERKLAGKRYRIYMHRALVDAPSGMMVDHINHDTLDNRRSNLRLATVNENGRNMRLPSHNSSGFKGVCWDKPRGKWKAYIHVNDKIVNLGRYEVMGDAVAAYDAAALQLHGEFARTNASLKTTPPAPSHRNGARTSAGQSPRRLSIANTTGVTGVAKLPSGAFCAYSKINGRQKHIGSYKTIEQAAQARESYVEQVRRTKNAA